MTDDELDAMTAPTVYKRLADPVVRGPLSLADVDRREARSTCANANNPFGHNPDCECGWRDVDRDREAYLEAEQHRFAAEVDRQRGWDY